MLRHIGLFEYNGFLRLYPRRYVVLCHSQNIRPHFVRIAERRKRVVIRDHEHAVVFARKFNERLQRPEVVAEVECSRWLESRE